ncbi:hypothetical protein QP999_02985 [Corynebacterium sp. MSK004]|uniref:hypothetical protein n=1 Tax=Corynebacterium sp. MSK004 TaxID=3050186 RepID=UPI00254E7385|nr:hypothetical protein [Corynebacterium sp. MSK004]MDK8896907.1 hypothetical protein [Corynebacterium sp. MSK004]
MTDLSTANLKRLLAETSPGPWEARGYYMDGEPRPDGTHQMRDAEGEYLGIMYGQEAHLTALASDLAQEVIRLRSKLAVQEAAFLDIFPTDEELGDQDG